MKLQLRQWVEESKNVVVFTGAGISTDSGIPDFRSPRWSVDAHGTDYAQDFAIAESNRIEAWRRKFAMQDEIGETAPMPVIAPLPNWLAVVKYQW